MATELSLAYRTCARATRRHARNFYYGFLTLPRRQRRAVYALYAFCREADDIADGIAPNRAKLDGLARLRARLDCAAEGAPRNATDLALSHTLGTFHIRSDDLHDVLDGVTADLTNTRMPDEAALHRYCYQVASAVGLATLPVLSNGIPPSPAMRQAAAHLGQGMQRINILRDIREDLSHDRIYLPVDELRRHGVSEEQLLRHEPSEGLRAILISQADRARMHLDHGRRLLALLPHTSRGCVWLLAEIYERILHRLADRHYDVFADRISLSTPEKLRLMVSALRPRS